MHFRNFWPVYQLRLSIASPMGKRWQGSLGGRRPTHDLGTGGVLGSGNSVSAPMPESSLHVTSATAVCAASAPAPTPAGSSSSLLGLECYNDDEEEARRLEHR